MTQYTYLPRPSPAAGGSSSRLRPLASGGWRVDRAGSLEAATTAARALRRGDGLLFAIGALVRRDEGFFTCFMDARSALYECGLCSRPEPRVAERRPYGLPSQRRARPAMTDSRRPIRHTG